MDDVDARLRAAAPATAALEDPRVQSALAAWPEGIRTADAGAARGGRRRPRRRVLALALAASLVVAARVMAAKLISAHTGWFGQGGEEGSGEFIRLDSPDFPRVLEQIRRREDLPLPPGASWAGLPSRFDVTQPSVETTSGIAKDVEYYARCEWLGAFVHASRAGDRALQRRAAHVIATIPSWPHIWHEGDDPEIRTQLHAQARAAAAGEPRDPDAAAYEPGNIARNHRVNCTDKAPGQ